MKINKILEQNIELHSELPTPGEKKNVIKIAYTLITIQCMSRVDHPFGLAVSN